MTDVPVEFRPHQIRLYPKDNETPFEEWFYKNYDSTQNKSDRVYLPIFWTSYYCNNKYGKDKRTFLRLQMFLSRLDKSKKYFTVVQYDDRILNDTSHIDLKVFGMGCTGDVQLPLVCQPHKYEFKETGRPIFASFIGGETHPIRTEMIKQLHGKEDYFISTEQTSLHSYCYIMSQSKFVLCPRGYGKTSFRIQEALQYGAIPVYISDEFLFDQGCITTNGKFDLSLISDDIIELKLGMIKGQYENNYTYESVARMIYENV